MDENKDKADTTGGAHLNWWSLLIRYTRLGSRRVESSAPVEMSNLSEPKQEMDREYCKHGRLRKGLSRSIRRTIGRPAPDYGIDGLCPVCGLLPRGDRMVEYVLTVRYLDGTSYEYCFRGRSDRDCYRITGGLLHILMPGSTLAYSMEVISSMTFGARVVPPDSPEVVRAMEIIAGRSALTD